MKTFSGIIYTYVVSVAAQRKVLSISVLPDDYM